MRFFFLNYIVSPLYFLPQIYYLELKCVALRLKFFVLSIKRKILLFQRKRLLLQNVNLLSQLRDTLFKDGRRTVLGNEPFDFTKYGDCHGDSSLLSNEADQKPRFARARWGPEGVVRSEVSSPRLL